MAPWDPWVALRARPHVEQLRLDPVAALLGGAMLVYIGERAVITLDPALDRRSRRVALAHELIHDERGGGCDQPGTPPGWDAVVARDEAAVDREVARRLVPPAGLRRWLDERFSFDEPVALWEVAEAFDVDEATAARALALVDACAPGRAPSASSDRTAAIPLAAVLAGRTPESRPRMGSA